MPRPAALEIAAPESSPAQIHRRPTDTAAATKLCPAPAAELVVRRRRVGGQNEQPRPKLCPSMPFSRRRGASELARAAASGDVARNLRHPHFELPDIRRDVGAHDSKQRIWGSQWGLFNFGAIGGEVLQRVGASLPWPVDLVQPWRLVTAVFLHGSLLHIFFNMWVLMDIGPQIEELYGSARYLFIYVVAGIGGYVVSSAFWHFSVGGSGALLGLIGVLLAMTVGRRTAGMQMLRGQLIRWLIYIGIWGLLFLGIDNWAHAGGLATGFTLGKLMTDRPPATPEEQKLAYALGWGCGAGSRREFCHGGSGDIASRLTRWRVRGFTARRAVAATPRCCSAIRK